MSVETLIPHRGPAVLVHELREWREEGCVVLARIPSDHPHLDSDGRLPAWAGLELMAQAASVFSGERHLRAGRPIRIGYLLGTRSYACEADSFPAGAELEIEVRVRFMDEEGGPSAFDCVLRQNSRVQARATLKAIETP